jgi:hypothetical protein
MSYVPKPFALREPQGERFEPIMLSLSKHRLRVNGFLPFVKGRKEKLGLLFLYNFGPISKTLDSCFYRNDKPYFHLLDEFLRRSRLIYFITSRDGCQEESLNLGFTKVLSLRVE